VCTLDRPVNTLDIQCAHGPIQCVHWGKIIFFRMSSVIIGRLQQQRGCCSQQQRSSSSLWSFMSLFQPAMENSWLLLRCIHAYQWFSHRSPLWRHSASAQHINHRSSNQPALNRLAQTCQPPNPTSQILHPSPTPITMMKKQEWPTRHASTRPSRNYTRLPSQGGGV
jgi:hypothetical protein